MGFPIFNFIKNICHLVKVNHISYMKNDKNCSEHTRGQTNTHLSACFLIHCDKEARRGIDE